MPQAQLKKTKPKAPAKPYVNSSTTDRTAKETGLTSSFL